MSHDRAALIKELRARTNAKMTDCIAALNASEHIIEDAVAWLRQKGKAAAAKIGNAQGSEGLVGALAVENYGVLLEMNAATDFAARAPLFQSCLTECLAVAYQENVSELSELQEKRLFAFENMTVSETIVHLSGMAIREPISLRRLLVLNSGEGAPVFHYVHNAVSLGAPLGRIAVLVALRGGTPELGKRIAMHIAASESVAALSVEDLNPEIVEVERKIALERAKDLGRPEKFLEGMVQGSMQKFYQESVLLEQVFLLAEDGKQTVKALIQAHDAEIVAFAKMRLGHEAVVFGGKSVSVSTASE